MVHFITWNSMCSTQDNIKTRAGLRCLKAVKAAKIKSWILQVWLPQLCYPFIRNFFVRVLQPDQPLSIITYIKGEGKIFLLCGLGVCVCECIIWKCTTQIILSGLRQQMPCQTSHMCDCDDVSLRVDIIWNQIRLNEGKQQNPFKWKRIWGKKSHLIVAE